MLALNSFPLVRMVDRASSYLLDQVLGTHTGRDTNEILSLLFHPSEQILLASDIEGCIHFNLFDLDENICHLPEGMGAKPFKPHKTGSCRTMEVVTASDCMIASGGSNKRVVISSFDPKVISKYVLENPVYSLKALNEHFIVAGDDEGCISGIDIRTKAPVFRIQEQEDYISSITPTLPYTSPLKSIACTSGDCTLAVYDLRMAFSKNNEKKRKDRLVAMSDPQEDELNCSIVLNSEQTLLTGDANGVVGIWKQGYWGDLKDRLPLYQKSDSAQKGMDGAHSIDGLKKIDEKNYILVSSDGIIRECGLFPNQVTKVVGVHRNTDNTEIATISGFDVDVELGLVATTTGDSEGRIKFWRLNSEIDADEEEEVPKPSKKQNGKKAAPNKSDLHRDANRASKQEFFSEL
jgi:WD40 repeat protein